MSTEQSAPVVNSTGYGYADDQQKVNPFNFGLNQNTFMTKFEWIPNGGKDGAEQEAIDVIFNINGTDRSYRLFPVTQGFDANNNPVTDPNAPEFKEALTDFNAIITHILHAYLGDREAIKLAFARPIPNFKEFAKIAASVLPVNFKEIPMDIFLQYQWQIRDNAERTYLEIPKKMKYGPWLTKTQPGKWKELKVPNPSTNTRDALTYVEETTGAIHPFVKNGWFMNSNFAIQQKADGTTTSNEPAAAATQAAATATQQDGAAKASAW